jgi:hypothetical protein
MPLTRGQRVAYGVTQNNFTVNSISTHFVDLQPLEPGQTAADVAPFAPGTFNSGGPMISPEEAARRNIQRAQFDAPNWVGVLVASHATTYERHADIPVWVNEQGVIQGVDVETMLKELEPLRQRATAVWGQEEGFFSDFHQAVAAPKNILKAIKTVAAVPGEFKEMFKEMKGEPGQGKPADPVPVHFRPDMSQYPPVDGMDYQTMVMIQVDPETIAQTDFTDETRRMAALKVWNDRVLSDWKLSTLFSTDVDRLRKGVSPSWES